MLAGIPRIQHVLNFHITNKSNFIVYGVFYSKCSHQHMPASIPAICGVELLQDHKSTNVVTCVTITPYQSKL